VNDQKHASARRRRGGNGTSGWWRRAITAALGTAAAFAVTLGFVGLPALAARPGHTTECAERVYDRLFFGLGISGGALSEMDWTRFLAEVVTPRFPGGLTVLHARGQWRAAGESGVTIEPSRVVEIAHDDTPAFDHRLDEVIALYKVRHRQRSVMRTRSRVDVCW
jgi:hypothetical protein